MSNFANHVYERTIDYIQNQENKTDIRYEYSRYMSTGNWNNNEMGNLVDVICIVADQELNAARTEREEQNILANCIANLVDYHVGYVVMADRRTVDALDDRTYHSLKDAAGRWEDVLAQLSGRGRGRGMRPQVGQRQGGYTQGRRSVFDNAGGPGSRRSVFDNDNGETSRASSNGSFGSGPMPSTRTSRVFDDQPDEQRPGSGFASAFGNQRASGASTTQNERQVHRPEPTPVATEEARAEGPDFSKERPYDNFWLKGENWQLAHVSSFKWSSSPRQQLRRSYDPEQEIRFLVKGTDNTIREEFIAMTADLAEETHRIRNTARPNRPREALIGQEGDSLMVGEDIDAVDLDAVEKSYRCVRRDYLGDINVNDPVIGEKAVAIANFEEGVLVAAGEGAKVDNDVVTCNTYEGIGMVTDQPTIKAIEALSVSIGQPDFDLLAFNKRMNSLRGIVTENVMNYVDRHFTKEVNDALADQFGFSNLTIDSFLDDFGALLSCKRFTNLGAAYITQFLSRTRILVASLQYLTSKEDRLEYLECGDLLSLTAAENEQAQVLRENVLIIFKLRAFVHVKAALDVFGMVDNEMRVPQRSGEGADPVMADLLRNLYQAGRKTSGAGRVYMVTADNICVELVPASGARDVVGLRMA